MNYFSKLKRRIIKHLQTRATYKFVLKDWISLHDLDACSRVLGTMRFSANILPLQMTAPQKRRIFVIAPHPDDEILGAGGTLLQALDSGSDLSCLYLTAGRPSEASALREEAAAICSHLGYQIDFLPYFSQEIPLNRTALEEVSSRLTKSQAKILFLPFLLDDHDDHRRASHLLLEASRQGLLPDTDIEVWAYQVYTALLPNVVVDITPVIERKKLAMRSWKSQGKKWNWEHFTLGINAFNTRFLKQGQGEHYVEAFFVLPLKEYLELCAVYFDSASEAGYYVSGYQKTT